MQKSIVPVFIKTLQKNPEGAMEDYDYSIKLDPALDKAYYFRGWHAWI